MSVSIIQHYVRDFKNMPRVLTRKSHRICIWASALYTLLVNVALSNGADSRGYAVALSALFALVMPRCLLGSVSSSVLALLGGFLSFVGVLIHPTSFGLPIMLCSLLTYAFIFTAARAQTKVHRKLESTESFQDRRAALATLIIWLVALTWCYLL